MEILTTKWRLKNTGMGISEECTWRNADVEIKA